MIVSVADRADVVAVIPTLGRDPARLARCVAALRAQSSSARLAIVVVLNSPDEFPPPAWIEDCTVLRPGLNLGWSGGLHLGRASAPEVARLWLIQDDMAPDSHCLTALITELDADPSLAAVSPLVVGDDGRVTAGSCGGVLRHHPTIDVDHWYPDAPQEIDSLDELDELDYVPSRGMLVDGAVWDELGGMDPGYYPVVWADVDFCTAIRASGRRFALAREALTRHDGQGSTPGTYGRFLFARHRQRYRDRWADDRRPAVSAHDAVPEWLAQRVAVAAASLAADLAADRTQLIDQRDELEQQNARLRHDLAALRESTSWRVTAPFRAVSRILGRRLPRR